MKFKPLPLYADCSKNLIKNPSKSLTIFPQCSDFDFLNLPEFSNLTNFHFNNIAGNLNKCSFNKTKDWALVHEGELSVFLIRSLYVLNHD